MNIDDMDPVNMDQLWCWQDPHMLFLPQVRVHSPWALSYEIISDGWDYFKCWWWTSIICYVNNQFILFNWMYYHCGEGVYDKFITSWHSIGVFVLQPLSVIADDHSRVIAPPIEIKLFVGRVPRTFDDLQLRSVSEKKCWWSICVYTLSGICRVWYCSWCHHHTWSRYIRS